MYGYVCKCYRMFYYFWWQHLKAKEWENTKISMTDTLTMITTMPQVYFFYHTKDNPFYFGLFFFFAFKKKKMIPLLLIMITCLMTKTMMILIYGKVIVCFCVRVCVFFFFNFVNCFGICFMATLFFSTHKNCVLIWGWHKKKTNWCLVAQQQ